MRRSFHTPLVPLVPIMGIVFCLYLMASLPGVTWLRFFVWMAAGLVVYFTYGRFHSRVALDAAAEAVTTVNLGGTADAGGRHSRSSL